MKKKETYALAWYSVETDEIVGEENVKLSQDTVRELFSLPEDEPAIYCYDVTASQRKHLLKLVKAEIDLNKFVYQIEGRADDE